VRCSPRDCSTACRDSRFSKLAPALTLSVVVEQRTHAGVRGQPQGPHHDRRRRDDRLVIVAALDGVLELQLRFSCGPSPRKSIRAFPTWSTATRPARSSPPGSPRKRCRRCSRPPAPAGSGTTSRTGCTASTVGTPAAAPARTRAPGRHHRSVVARGARLPPHRHHQRRNRGDEPNGQDHRAHRLRLPQPRQPTPSSTVRLHSATTRQHRRATAR